MSDRENFDVGLSGVTFDMDAYRRSSLAPGWVLTFLLGASRTTSVAASVSEWALPSASEPTANIQYGVYTMKLAIRAFLLQGLHNESIYYGRSPKC